MTASFLGTRAIGERTSVPLIGLDCVEQHHVIATWLDDLCDMNAIPIGQLNGCFRIVAGSFVVQVLCWTTAIGGTL